MGGSIASDAGNNSFSVSLDVTQPDLKLGAEVLADVLLNATMPEKVFSDFPCRLIARSTGLVGGLSLSFPGDVIPTVLNPR